MSGPPIPISSLEVKSLSYGPMRSIGSGTSKLIKFTKIKESLMIDLEAEGGRIPFGFDEDDYGRTQVTLTVSDLVESKLLALQAVLVEAAVANRAAWFGPQVSEDAVRYGFIPMVKARVPRTDDPEQTWPAQVRFKVDAKTSMLGVKTFDPKLQLIDFDHTPLTRGGPNDHAYRNRDYQRCILEVTSVYSNPKAGGGCDWGICKRLVALKLAETVEYTSQSKPDFLCTPEWAAI